MALKKKLDETREKKKNALFEGVNVNPVDELLDDTNKMLSETDSELVGIEENEQEERDLG
jgi:hypothetical protein